MMIRIIILLHMILISACSTTYYDYTEQEWRMLSKQEKQAVIEEYQYILEQKNKQAHKDLIDSYKEKVIQRGIEYIPPE